MGIGLFKTLFGRIDQGIFPDLYSHEGSTSRTKRMDIRLGNYEFSGFGQEDDDDDDDDVPVTVAAAAPTPAATKLSLPTAPSGAPTGPSVFSKDKEGFPMWVVGIFILGFALAWRQNKKSKSA